MFTGIIESVGTIESISADGTNITFYIKSDISDKLSIDQSISHNGICLTVESVEGNTHRVTAIQETISITTAGFWKVSDQINLEQCMRLNSRLDGHIVQGHVDCTASCIEINHKNGSTEYTFSFDEKFAPLIIEKGSVAINGISLTAFNVTRNTFTVAIIPYTLSHTNMYLLKHGIPVNIEFDVIGKYILRNQSF